MKKVSAILALAGSTALVSTTQAFVFWSNSSGSTANFTWSGGGSDNGYFGSPIVVGGNTFVFFPSNFRAESTGTPRTATRNDRLDVELSALGNFRFDQVTITEVGDYGMLDTGGRVSANIGLFVTDLATAITANANATFDLRNVEAFGNWNLAAHTTVVNAAGQNTDSDHIRIVVNNNLAAQAIAGSNSFIEKKVGAIIITVPTPGSLALMGMSGLAAFRRRR